MYSLLIVDDEVLELETLRDYVDWSSYGISVVAIAKNGKSALNIAIEYKPDIIITDIKMHIMDGIEFSKKLREANITSKLIFLTGYDDFSYAKSAINVQASGYILKPFSMDELHEVINHVKEELEAEKLRRNSIRLSIEKRFEFLINSTGKEVIQAIIGQLSREVSYDFAGITYNLMLIYCDSDATMFCKDYVYSLDEHAQFIMKDLSCTAVILNSNICDSRDLLTIAKTIQHDILEESKGCVSIIYSNTVFELGNLSSEYNKIIVLEECLFYSGKNSILNASTDKVTSTDKIKIPFFEGKFIEVLFACEKMKIQQVMNEYFDFMIKNKISKYMLRESLFNLLLYVWENFFKNKPDINPELTIRTELWNEILLCKDINDVYSFTEKYIEKIEQYRIEIQKDKNQQVVDKVKKFIEKNFGNEIAISDIAKDIYLSPNYIRNIFKEKTSITFLDYLVSFRMKKASEFLKDKSLKVHEVSNMVGYENVSYFCSVFAKHYGLSPNEYRNKY